MKILIFSMLCISGFIFSQVIPQQKLPEIKVDSIVTKVHPNFSFKSDPEKLLNSTESFENNSFVKKPENPEQYTLLVKKPDMESVISIPNAFDDKKKQPLMSGKNEEK